MGGRKPIRWWPCLAVALPTAAALIWVWTSSGTSGQEKVTHTYLVLFLALLLEVLWLVALSRLSWKVRLFGLGALVAAVAFFLGLFRIRGVSGDLVPVVAWRWQAEVGAGLGTDGAGAAGVSTTPTPFDSPQFHGRGRDGRVRGVHLARDWQAEPPRLLWRREVGAGWSAFAVVGEVAVTQEQRGDEEAVVAYELGTGRQLWSHGDPVRFEKTIGGIGPRATPAIAGGRVFAMGATGILNALDLRTGRRLWRHDVVEEAGAVAPEWGKSCSPLVMGDLVVVSAGGAGGRSLVAYEAATGEEVWSGGDDDSGYSSPLLATLAGHRQIVIFNAGSVMGHEPATGEVLWRHPWPAQQPNVAQPLPLDEERLLVSSGYGIGSKLLRIAEDPAGRLEASILWESPRLKAKFSQFHLHGGVVYGFDDGVFSALDPATGERLWKRGRYGHGQSLLVEDLLLLLTERGELVLIEPDREELRELATFQVLDGKSWNPPTLAGSRLLVRDDAEAACYELPLATALEAPAEALSADSPATG